MKSLSDLLHKTPWWLLVGGGLLAIAAIAIFATPFHVMKLEKSGATTEEKRAIKREIDTVFSESAIDVARGIVRELKSHTKDPARRAELERALEEIDEARTQLREAGREVVRAKREAADTVGDAVRDATRTITEAQREAARALRDAGVDSEKVSKSLEESVRLAREAETEARKVAEERAKTRVEEAQARYEEARQRAREQRRVILGEMPRGAITIDLDKGPEGAPPLPQLSVETRENIRKQISGDLRRIGVSAGVILVFIPLFILLVVSKFFIDRSRASLRVAEVKRKEADYHRMAQQVTEAKLQALQAQVEPHFLYNTLASVQALTEVDPARASTLTGHLIMYLRNALPKMRESISTVEQEIELVRAYLNILQIRMGDRLSFEIDVPPELMNAPVPPLMLPTLVENAIKHGLEPQREGGKVTIKAEARDGVIRLSVADTGKGFADNLGSGVGLANIRERLAGIYGDKAKLTLEARGSALSGTGSDDERGVVAAIEIPREGARTFGSVASFVTTPGATLPPAPEPKGAAAKTLAALGTAERVWRKGLSFAFFALVIVAAVICGLALVGVLTGLLPVQLGDDSLGGPTGALIGTAGILLAFTLIVLALAIVIAVFYGLGFLAVGLIVFIPLVIVVAMVPALAPFILVGLLVWWLVRRHERKRAAEERAALDRAAAAAPPAAAPAAEKAAS